MNFATTGLFAALCLSSLAAVSAVPAVTQWRDPSPHQVSYVKVEEDVRLEVLDWGGASSKVVILLPGLGFDAHVYDGFALKLTPYYRVVGITRRGYGMSSVPDSGYSADRLGDDVLAVMTALKLSRPILVGHSIGGQELSSIASRFPRRIAAAIYLDAAYEYAFDDGVEKILTWRKNLAELRKQLEALEAEPYGPKPLAKEILQTSWREVQHDLETLDAVRRARPDPVTFEPTEEDMATFESATLSYAKQTGVAIPEASFRNIMISTPDGRPTMRPKASDRITNAIHAGQQKYKSLPVPILAIFAVDNKPRLLDIEDPEARIAMKAYESVRLEQVEMFSNSLKKIAPQARIVVFQHSNHFVFLTNESEVVEQMRTFIMSIP